MFKSETHRRRKSVGRRIISTHIKPVNDRCVVCRCVGECLTGERHSRPVSKCAGITSELQDDSLVVGGINHYSDGIVVFCRRSHHRRTADIDQFDRRVRSERIQIAHDEVDGRNSVRGNRREVFGHVTTGKDATVNGRMKGLHSAVEHLGKTRDLFHALVFDSRRCQGRRRPSA